MDFVEAYAAALSPICRPLLDWYAAARRRLPWRETPTPYRVWVSEIMLQQTRVQAVIPYYERFLSLFPDVKALAAAPQDQLLKAWEGLGYYSRARNLQRAAQLILEHFDGRLPERYEDWLALPGVGPYTAGAVCSIALGLPVPAVDGNVLRVFARLLALEEDVAAPRVRQAMTRLAAAILPADRPGEFNQALMELGATVCLPGKTPRCGSCPLSDHCRALSDQNQALFPLKSPKKPRKIQPVTVLLLSYQGRWALTRRPDTGLLAGLWAFPHAEGALSAAQSAALLAPWVRLEEPPVPLPPASHIFTHLERRITGWRWPVQKVLPGCPFRWATPEQLQKQYPIPSAFSPFLPLCDCEK